jgi:hypothetical protein
MQTDIPAIRNVIRMLYKSAEVPQPSVENCIVPLGELVESTNITCTELTSLTNRLAMEFLLREGGLLEPFDAPDTDLLAGFLYVNANFGSIFVERTDLLVRRRFSVAHELGHYILHFRPLLDAIAFQHEPTLTGITDAFPQSPEETEPDVLPAGVVLTQSIGSDLMLPPLDQMEREANQFAAELLMPVSVVQDLVKKYTPTFHDKDLVWRLATDMLVSQSAMDWRLRNLGLLPPKTNRSN